MRSIRIDRPDPSTLVLTIDRPERKNALRRQDIVEITALVRGIGDDTACLVITGNGAFCAGADLASLGEKVAEGPVTPSLYEAPHDLIRALLACPAPTIAAVDGPAVGMGTDLALACDCRLIGSDGWLRQGWAAHGVIPATGGVRFLRHLAPNAIWAMLDGQPKLDGLELERFGLGERVAHGTAISAAVVRARSFAALPRRALRAYVDLSRRDLLDGLDDELAECARIQAELFNDKRFARSIAGALSGSGGPNDG